MPENNKIDLPSFFEVGEHKIDHLLDILEEHNVTFASCLLLGDPKTFLIGAGGISHSLAKASIKVHKHLISNSDESSVNAVKKIIDDEKPALVIGFGGGKVLDVAKLASGHASTKFIAIPTTLSNDGISSPVSVICDKDMLPVSHITKAPFGVIVDTSIIKKAPVRYIKCGIGDLLSNLSAVWDARLAIDKNKEKIPATALELAQAGPLNLLEFNEKTIKTGDFLLTLARGLIKSGFAMCIVGSSRPASGSEHKISHAIDHLYPAKKKLHGEQVGIAALFSMKLQNNEHFEKILKFYELINFPTKIKYLNLNVDQFVKIVSNAHQYRPDRYTILEDKRPDPDLIREIIKTAGL